jgi:hypothetical protein
MAITNARLLVEPRIDGTPGVYAGTGAPGSEVYDKSTLYIRSDAVGLYQSDGAGTWTTFLDSVSSIASHAATATSASGTGATGSEGTGATGAAGTGATGATAPTFTGNETASAEVSYAPQAGTGFATAGQVVTTTENKTMAENEFAYCWFQAATQAPALILSNTAVSGAPAVFTIYGLAPVTNAGTYRILIAPTPTGSVESHTHTGPSHTHTGPSHTHTGPSHTHDTPILVHTITP